MICIACFCVLFLSACTINKPTHIQDSQNGAVYGEVYLYDTNFVEEYLGALCLEVTEQNGQITIKKNAPGYPNYVGYRLFATYNWEKPQITYHPTAHIDYTIQTELQFFLYFEDDEYKNISIPQYNTTVRFSKVKGNNRLRAEILYDGLKGQHATKPQFVKGELPFLQADYILELRAQ